MGQGRNFVPCKRVNGEIMMKIQVDPQVVTFQELVEDTVSYMMDIQDAYNFAKLSKKDIINHIKSNTEISIGTYGGYCCKEPELLNSYTHDPQTYNNCIIIVVTKLRAVFPQYISEDDYGNGPIIEQLRYVEE